MAAVAAQRRPFGALGRMSLVAAIHVAVLFAIARSLGIGVRSRGASDIGGHVIERSTRRPMSLPPPPDVPIVEQATAWCCPIPLETCSYELSRT